MNAPELFQPIARSPLSEEVRRQLLECIADGRLAPSRHVHEVELARQLGVSRTPLHAAMVALAQDGLVQSLGRRGWLIMPLTEKDARELYKVLEVLMPLAIVESATFLQTASDELRILSDMLEADLLPPLSRVRAETDWHSAIVELCPNETLGGLLRPLVVRASRFETICVNQGFRQRSGEIRNVSQRLEGAEAHSLARLVGLHWRERGIEVVDWIRRQASPDSGTAMVSGVGVA